MQHISLSQRIQDVNDLFENVITFVYILYDTVASSRCSVNLEKRLNYWLLEAGVKLQFRICTN